MKRMVYTTVIVIVAALSGVCGTPAITFCTTENALGSGCYRYDSAAVEMKGIARGFGLTSDTLLFGYGITSGNSDISTRCLFIGDTSKNTVAGLMVRNGNGASDPFFSVLIRNNTGMCIAYRNVSGANAVVVEAGSVIHDFLKINRTGNSFSAFVRDSAASSWQRLGSTYIIPLAPAMCAGIVHASGSIDRVTKSRFDCISGLPDGQPSLPPCTPVLHDFNSGITLPALGFTEIDKWIADTTGRCAKTVIAAGASGNAHMRSPAFVMPFMADTTRLSWDFSFDGDTAPSLYAYALYSQQSMSINHRAVIKASLCGSASKIITGIADTISSNLIAGDSVIVYDRTHVYGKITTAKKCRLINGAAVYDSIKEYAVVSFPSIPVMTVDTGAISKTVANGDSLNCLPGAYATLTVHANAKVRFGAGTYTFSRIILNPDVRIYMDTDSSASILIKVRNSLQFADRDTMIMSSGAQYCGNVKIYTNQSVKMSLGTDLRLYGYLIAPNAEINFASRGTMIVGGIYAKKISFEPEVNISVNIPGARNNVLSVKWHQPSADKPVYSVDFTAHRATADDTLHDIIIRRDSVTVYTYATGNPTPMNTWMHLDALVYDNGGTNRLQLRFNNGSGTVLVADTVPLAIDSLAGLSFDYKKSGFTGPPAARVDNISLSCAIDSCREILITMQPADTEVYEGAAATFSCEATAGSDSLIFQWYRDGIPIPWANNQSYSPGLLTTADNGSSYYCTISGTCDTAMTDAALLNVFPCEDPVISAQPQDDTAYLNTAAVFKVTASGIGLSYQWKRNDNLMPGDTNAICIVNPVQPFNNLDRYRVVVSNSCGRNVRSADAILVIPDAGRCRITSQPSGDTLMEGEMFKTEISAMCEGAAYQWYGDGSPVSGATLRELEYGPVKMEDNGREFYCVVNNGITFDTSITVVLYVRKIASHGGSVSISGDLFDGDGRKVGEGSVERMGFRVQLYIQKIGGEPVYTERFGGIEGIAVIDGAFTVTLGRGKSDRNLQVVVAGHKELYAEVSAGKGGGFELVAPRLPLTAVPYAFTCGVSVIYGSGSPDGSVVAPPGTMYVDRNDADATWKKAKTRWIKLD